MSNSSVYGGSASYNSDIFTWLINYLQIYGNFALRESFSCDFYTGEWGSA